MNELRVNAHIGEQIAKDLPGIQIHVIGPLCYMSRNGGSMTLWDLFRESTDRNVQYALVFKPWAERHGLPLDPYEAARATGYSG